MFERKNLPSLRTLTAAGMFFLAAGCKQEKDFNDIFSAPLDGITVYGADQLQVSQDINSKNVVRYIENAVPFPDLKVDTNNESLNAQHALKSPAVIELNKSENPNPLDPDAWEHIASSLAQHNAEQKLEIDSLEKVEYTNEVLQVQNPQKDIIPKNPDKEDVLNSFKEVIIQAVGMNQPEIEVKLLANQTVVVPVMAGKQQLEIGISSPTSVMLGQNQARVELSAPSILGLPVGAGVIISHKGADLFLQLGKVGSTGIKIGLNNIGNGGPMKNVKTASIGVNDLKMPGGHTVGFGYEGGEHAGGLYVTGKFKVQTKNGEIKLQPILRLDGITPGAYFRVDF